MSEIASLIDHTILKPDATREDVLRVCREAREYGFASVCVNPYWVPLVARQLEGSPVKVCSVVGFPLGATTTETKVLRNRKRHPAWGDGDRYGHEYWRVRSGDLETVKVDIAAVAQAAHKNGAILKVIIETALLDDARKVTACELAVAAKADFVKTSTGFSTAGATVHDVELMRRAVGPQLA